MMKKFLVTVVALTFSASLALAGGKDCGDHGKSDRAHSAHFSKKLNLSEGQELQLEEMHKTFRAENEPLWTSLKQTKKEYRAAREANDAAKADALRATLDSQKAQMKQRKEAQHQRMLTLLTPDQREKLETMKSEKGSHGEHFRK